VRSTWKELTAGLSDEDLALFSLYRDFARELPDSTEEVHTSQVQHKRERIFTSGYVKSHYLEIGVELLRIAAHHASEPRSPRRSGSRCIGLPCGTRPSSTTASVS
jgi:hypothetical protein